MAIIYTDPFTIYRGSEPTFTFIVAITNGGTDREFYFRVGRVGAPAQVQKTMTETNSTSTHVTVTASLSASETAAIKESLVDFQVICTNPLDVVTDGKLTVMPMIRATL